MSVASFIASQRTSHGVPHALSCRALEVSQSWFYKWRDRRPTSRQTRRRLLAAEIRRVFDDSAGTYGLPRITAELRAAGWRVRAKTVAALMRQAGLVARPRTRRRSLTRPDATAPSAPDLLRRDFTAPAPDVKWCGDITEIRTGEGRLYLASVQDLYSGRLLGHALGQRHDAALVRAALHMAVPCVAAPWPQ